MDYFIVLDEAPIRRNKTPKYELMYGIPAEALGTVEAAAADVETLLRKVPAGEPVYRRYLQRTDGKTGVELIRG